MEWRYLKYVYTFPKAREAKISEPSKPLEKRVVVQAQAPSLAKPPSKPRYQAIFCHREEARGIDPLQVPTHSARVCIRSQGRADNAVTLQGLRIKRQNAAVSRLGWLCRRSAMLFAAPEAAARAV